MMNEPQITIQGNMAGEPELRYTATGRPVASFSVACNPRVRNAAGEWENGETVFLRVTAWGDLAENVCESLRRGDPVLVAGRLRQRTWEDRESGQPRRADDVQADTVAVPLDRRTVRMTKVTRERAESPADGPAGPDGSQPASEPGSPAAAAREPAEPATA